MKYLITERQYELIIEQTNDVDWLINWFKKVPEDKLRKSFKTLDSKGRENTMTRNEIIQILSDINNVVIVKDPLEIKKFDGRIGFFQGSPTHNILHPGTQKYFGKIVINGDWKKIASQDPQYMDTKDTNQLKHHEQIHLLQSKRWDNKTGQWDSGASKTISRFCKGNPDPECGGLSYFYYSNPNEIYGHLFSMREILGIEPIDKIIDANTNIKGDNVTINVTVSRNGKTIKLPAKTIKKEFTSFATIYCCNKFFKDSFMYLHNTLAKNLNPNKPESEKMV